MSIKGTVLSHPSLWVTCTLDRVCLLLRSPVFPYTRYHEGSPYPQVIWFLLFLPALSYLVATEFILLFLSRIFCISLVWISFCVIPSVHPNHSGCWLFCLFPDSWVSTVEYKLYLTPKSTTLRTGKVTRVAVHKPGLTASWSYSRKARTSGNVTFRTCPLSLCLGTSLSLHLVLSHFSLQNLLS